MSTEHLKAKFGAIGEKGGKGEDWLFEKLKRQYEVQDFRKDMSKQIDGIDFSIKKPTWFRAYTLDCKTNLFIDKDNKQYTCFEYVKNGKPGWFIKSKADRIYHINVEKGKGLFYDLNQMRQIISRRLLFQDMKGFELLKKEQDLLLKIDLSLPEIKILLNWIY